MTTSQSYESVALGATPADALQTSAGLFNVEVDARPRSELGDQSQAYLVYLALHDQARQKLDNLAKELEFSKDGVSANLVQQMAMDVESVMALHSVLLSIVQNSQEYLSAVHHHTSKYFTPPHLVKD